MGGFLDKVERAVARVRAFAYGDAQAQEWRRPRLGLALGGGFARGIAHIGVLRVFEEDHIPIDYIAGTSVGGLIAAAYAGGSSLNEMQRQAASTRFTDFARWTASFKGLASDTRLEQFLARLTPIHRFEELRIPLSIVATDLIRGEPAIFSSGEVGPALCASCAYPGLFRPVERDGKLLVDGFLTAPVPVEAVRRMGAELVIAISLGSITPFQKPRNVIEVVGRSFSIVQRYAESNWRPLADVVIEPDVADFLWDDFSKTPQLVAAGEAATRAALTKIRAALSPPVAAPAAGTRLNL